MRGVFCEAWESWHAVSLAAAGPQGMDAWDYFFCESLKNWVRAVLFGLFPVWGYSGYVPGDTGYETYCYLWTLILTGLWRSWWVFRSSLKLLHSMKKLGRMWNNIFSHCYQLCCRVWFSPSVRPCISSTGQTPSKTEAGVVQKDLCLLLEIRSWL